MYYLLISNQFYYEYKFYFLYTLLPGCIALLFNLPLDNENVVTNSIGKISSVKFYWGNFQFGIRSVII